MSEHLIDSSIIIDDLRGNVRATAYLDDLRRVSPLSTHAVVVAEVLQGARNLREQQVIDELFEQFDVRHIEAADSLLALDLFHRLRLARGVGYWDCLIAATCMRVDSAIVTLNEKHFRAVPDLKVIRPY